MLLWQQYDGKGGNKKQKKKEKKEKENVKKNLFKELERCIITVSSLI